MTPARPRIATHPAKTTTSRSTTFRLVDGTAGVIFHYQLDRGKVRAGNPARFTKLAYKRHTLRVWVTKNGKTSKTVSCTWKVQRKASRRD